MSLITVDSDICTLCGNCLDECPFRLLEMKTENSFPTPREIEVRSAEERCVNCGACVGQCLPKAITVDEKTREVRYDTHKCVTCELCIPACPFDAIESIRTYLNKKGEI